MSTTSRTKEHTWDKARQVHTCCQSKAAWRHKLACPANTGDGKLPPDHQHRFVACDEWGAVCACGKPENER